MTVGDLVNRNGETTICKVTWISPDGKLVRIKPCFGTEEEVHASSIRSSAKYARKQRINQLVEELTFLGAYE